MDYMACKGPSNPKSGSGNYKIGTMWLDIKSPSEKIKFQMQ